MSILPKASYRFTAIPTKIPRPFFTERTKKSKIYMDPQKTPDNQIHSEKKRTKLDVSHSLILNYIIKHSHQNSMVFVKGRYIDQWNRFEK